LLPAVSVIIDRDHIRRNSSIDVRIEVGAGSP
jgi:hypothetical protein